MPPTQSDRLRDRHITRDFRNLKPGSPGRELEFLDHEDFPPQDGLIHDVSEGAVWKTPNGWYQRQGEYWAPIYEPHEPGVVDAVVDAAAGNTPCGPSTYGNGCPGASLEAVDFIDELTEAGWRIVRVET